MKTTPVTHEDLAASVIAVPPLARGDDLSPAGEQNVALVRYLESGGVRTLLYGGNANLYHTSISEYAALLEQIAVAAGGDTLVVPSVGPAYGTMMDQADIVKEFRFPTAMVLPHGGPTTPDGVAEGIRRFAEALGGPVILYLKREGYLDVHHVRQLVDEGLVLAIKYAIVRPEPSDDAFLERLCDAVERRFLVSGIGERPAIVHLRDFGLHGFTSGSVCIAPRRSMELLAALKRGDVERAEEIRRGFLPLEDLRDEIHPIRVLHDAVGLAGIADMGPILPLLSNLSEEERDRVAPAAAELRRFDELQAA